MKIIVGLGNPEKDYADTRHNIGFAFADKLKELWDFEDYKYQNNYDAWLSQGSLGDEKIILVKPETFMNESGRAVKKIMQFYKLTADDIIVIHDDLDIAIGKFKIATDSSSAGHNGVQDIIDKLGTQKFKRIRVGIGEATEEGAIRCHLGAHDFVLAKFTEEEKEKIYPALLQIIETELPKLIQNTN
jgi:peptidyl-tRNA hydrolase, PTH1 family